MNRNDGWSIGIVCDDTGGERWFHEASKLSVAATAQCFRGLSSEGGTVFVKRVEGDPLDPLFDDDYIASSTREIDAYARLNDSPNLLRLLGTGRTRTDGICRVFEWASDSLADRPDVAREEVGPPLMAALRSMHAAGLVHSDVHPGNVLLVNGAWVLADLDGAVGIGQPVVRHPRDSRFKLPGLEIGQPARFEQDWVGLGGVLGVIGH